MIREMKQDESYDFLNSLEALISCISNRLNVEDLESEYLRSIAALIPAHATALYIFRSTEPRPIRIAARGVDEDFLSYYETTGRNLDPLFNWLTRNRTPNQSQILLGLEGWQRHPIYGVVSTAEIDFAMQSPILSGDSIIGSLNFGRQVDEGPFSCLDLKAVSILSRFLALAIANSLGYSDFDRRQKSFCHAINHIPEGVVITDSKYKVQYANNVAQRLAAHAFGADRPSERLSDLIWENSQPQGKHHRTKNRRLTTRDCILPGSNMQQSLVLLDVPVPAPVETHLRKILTDREIDVLRLIERGMHNRDIADTLCISTNTVKRHLDNIYCKLDVNSRTELLSKIYYLINGDNNE